jgi:hypothetical protein
MSVIMKVSLSFAFPKREAAELLLPNFKTVAGANRREKK